MNELEEEKILSKGEELKDPIEERRMLAITVKKFIEKLTKRDAKEHDGTITEFTGRWIERYDRILDGLHKAINGKTRLDININKVSHTDIAAKMREYEEQNEYEV